MYGYFRAEAADGRHWAIINCQCNKICTWPCSLVRSALLKASESSPWLTSNDEHGNVLCFSVCPAHTSVKCWQQLALRFVWQGLINFFNVTAYVSKFSSLGSITHSQWVLPPQSWTKLNMWWTLATMRQQLDAKYNDMQFCLQNTWLQNVNRKLIFLAVTHTENTAKSQLTLTYRTLFASFNIVQAIRHKL